MITVSPAFKCFLVVEFEGSFYFDHNVPFGLASASGLQGEVVDAIIDIWHSIHVGPIIKWVNDFNVFCYPTEHGSFSGMSGNILYHYDYYLAHIKAMITPLRIPWHTTKGSVMWQVYDMWWNTLAQ